MRTKQLVHSHRSRRRRRVLLRKRVLSKGLLSIWKKEAWKKKKSIT